MDSNSHPYVIDADAEGTPRETAAFLVGTAVEFGLNPSTAIQRITRPEPGFRVTEALAEAIGGDIEPPSHDDEGFPLDGGPHGREKPEDWLALSDEGKRAYVYSEPPEPDLSGAKTNLAPEHDIHGEPTETAYESWDYPDLVSAVATRGLVTEDKKGPTLAAALRADDIANADPDDADEADSDS